MLYLVSAGLWDEKDISLRGLETLKKCDEVFLELYTDNIGIRKESLEKLIGKEVKVLRRKDLEEDYERILERSREKDVAIVVGGDALVATTHAMLLLEARKRNVETRVIHSSSVISAVAECGLHAYKFGAIVTIPLRERTMKALPESVYRVIKENLERGLHTLCLLDVDVEAGKFLSVREALETLMSLEEKLRQGAVSTQRKIVVASKLGSEEQRIVFGSIEEVYKVSEELKLPAVIIIPGKLHFTEEEFLKFFELKPKI